MSVEMDEIVPPETSPPTSTPKQDVVDVTVHPLVLLSAADHYHRVARGTRKRVVGILLGTVSRGRVDATNSFAVPFEEDNKNPVRRVAVLSFDNEPASCVSVSTHLNAHSLCSLCVLGCLLFGS